MIASLRQFFFGTLSRQLIFGMMAFYVVVIGVFITDLAMRQGSLLLQQKIGQAEALSQSIAVSAADWLISKDYDGLQEIVDAQKHYPEVTFAMILDENGMVVAHTDRQHLGKYVIDMPTRPATSVIHNTSVLIDAASPVMIKGKKIGWVRVGLDRRIVTARLDTITRDSVAYGFVAIVIAFLLAYGMGSYIARRMHAIQFVADAVQAGDMSQRTDITGDDEAAALARQFNSMLDRIAADEAKLKESESRYRMIFNDSPVAILEGDLSAFKARLDYLHQSGVRDISDYLDANPDEVAKFAGLVHINDINQAAVRLMGAANKEQVSMNLFSYFTVGSSNIFKQQIIALDAGAMRFESEVPLKSMGKETRFITFSLLILPEYVSTWSKMLVSFMDITERKHADEKIKQLNDELEEKVRQRTIQLETANKELEAFAYSVSHDLRAPLRAIDGFSAVIMEDYSDKLDDDGKEYLQRVRHAAQKMSDLIDDLLNLSRLTRGELHKQSIHLSDVATKVIANLRESDPVRDVEVVIAENMDDEGDPHLVEVALTNLLSNAWKFTSKKDKAKIEFGSFEKGENKVYYIKDNGAGFNMDYSNKLFLPFQRLHTSDEFSGTGIGLAIVYRIIKKHGGEIWAQGQPDGGATFYFTFSGGMGS